MVRQSPYGSYIKAQEALSDLQLLQPGNVRLSQYYRYPVHKQDQQQQQLQPQKLYN
jgi:hypothetical protein